MRRWVVTGPAGAGKSLFCRYLAGSGAAILDGDSLGHEILDRPDVHSALEREFGPTVLENGSVDRGVLGGIVFQSTEALEKLNRITHGPLAELVAARFDDIEESGSHDLAVLEAAVYFLLPRIPGVDLVITVTAADAVRMSRLREGSGLSPKQAAFRVEAQRHMEGGWASADVVVVNEGSPESLEAEVASILARLED